MSFLKYFLTGMLALIIVLTSVNNIAFAENAEAEAHNNQGTTYYNADDYKKALEEYNAAIKLDDKNALYYANRGWAYYNLKNYDEAEKDFNKAIQLDSNCATAYEGRAYVYNVNNNEEKAERDLITAGDINYDAGDYEAALSDFDDVLSINENSLNYSNRGWANYYLKKYDDAEKDFSKAIQLDENYANAYRGRSAVYMDQEKNKEAIADLNKAGIINFNLKAYDEAKIDFDNTLSLDENDADAKFYLALMAQDVEKNPHVAIEKYTELLDSGNAKNQEIIYTNRGAMYSELKEYDNAIKDFTKAIAINPTYLPAYIQRSNVYDEQLQEDDKAFLDYRAIVKINEAKKELSDEQKEEYEKKAQLCWDEMNVFEQISLMVRHPDASGKVNGLMKIFVIFMLIELALSVAYAAKSGTFNSKFVAQKFAQKAIFVIIVLAVIEMDEAELMDFNLKNPVIILFLLYEILSVLESAGNLGVPIPEDLRNIVQSIIGKIKEILRLD